MKLRNLMYAVIFIICIASIGVGIYTEVTKDNEYYDVLDFSQKNDVVEEVVEEEIEEENYGSVLKQDFLKVFDNKIHIGNFDDSTVKKLDENKPIVYTGYSSTEKTDNYEFNLNIPWINIDSQVAKTYNEESQEVLVNKIMEIMGSAKDKTIYDISYTVYVYNNTMSVIILSNLKEGSNAQRDMIRTYNYNLKTGEDISLKEGIVIAKKSESDVINGITQTIKESIQLTDAMKKAGYNVFSRDIDDDMYNIENSNTFYIDNEGTLYIIYAYGNEKPTSEMDIIYIK